MEPARTQPSTPAGICQSSDTQSSRDKVSKLTFWLCNYLLGYNCSFSCIIRLINTKLSDVASHLKWCSREPERRRMMSRKIRQEKSTALLGQGLDLQRLWAWCTLHTRNISDDCHSLALYTAVAPREQQTLLSPGEPSMYALTVLQRGREGTCKPPIQQERGQTSAGCSFLEKNITLQTSFHLKLRFCCLQKQWLLPAPVKHYF